MVDLDPLPLNQIEPDDLADALKTTPRIRWKVLVVNACYSGGFVDALRDDSTMVIASAREDRTSFGCGADSDITYFGKAFLAEALNQTTSIRDAFDIAKKSVDTWETDDKEEHSEPQIATSRSIEAKLAAWQRTLKAGAPGAVRAGVEIAVLRRQTLTATNHPVLRGIGGEGPIQKRGSGRMPEKDRGFRHFKWRVPRGYRFV